MFKKIFKTPATIDCVDTFKYDVSKMPPHMKLLTKEEHPAFVQTNEDCYNTFIEIIDEYIDEDKAEPTMVDKHTSTEYECMCKHYSADSIYSNIFKSKYQKTDSIYSNIFKSKYQKTFSIQSIESFMSNILKNKYQAC